MLRSGAPSARVSPGADAGLLGLHMLVVATVELLWAVPAHGLAGSWDEYALLLLAPLVVAAVLWVTRRGESSEPEEADEQQPQEIVKE